MKKRELVVGAIALSGSVAGMITTDVAYAGLGCNTVSSNAMQLVCTGTTAGATFLAQDLTFSGSNGVKMAISDSASEMQLCSAHVSGKSKYGMSTSSTVMESAAGTGNSAGSGGCA